MLLRGLFIVCIIFALNEHLLVDGRGGGGRGGGRFSFSRGSGHKTSTTGGRGGGWFSGWFGGGKSSSPSSLSSGTKKSVPPVLSRRNNVVESPSHIGFAAYGNNYQANFHNSRSRPSFQPVSHPYQSHFQPQTTDVFAYHFIPQMHVHHVYHHTYIGRHEPVYYDYRNSSSASTPLVTEPIIYDFKPSTSLQKDTSSDESDLNLQAANPNDVFIAGVENMLLYGDMKDNQHLVLFVQQDSDGITFENELFMAFNNFDTNETASLQYFPDVEFRFDADDEPNDDDLQNIYQMYKDLIDNGRC